MFFWLGANFSGFVGPNRTSIGIWARLIICIIPLSIDIAFSSLEANAVTRAGDANSDACSGKKAFGIIDLILLMISLFDFSTKKIGFFPFFSNFTANSINLFIGQCFFLYGFPCVIESPI